MFRMLSTLHEQSSPLVAVMVSRSLVNDDQAYFLAPKPFGNLERIVYMTNPYFSDNLAARDRPMKCFTNVAITLAGLKLAHRLCKHQFVSVVATVSGATECETAALHWRERCKLTGVILR